MQVHARAPLSPIGRRRVVERVRAKTWSVMAAAEAAGVTERTSIAGWRAFATTGRRG
jgi:transposase